MDMNKIYYQETMKLKNYLLKYAELLKIKNKSRFNH